MNTKGFSIIILVLLLALFALILFVPQKLDIETGNIKYFTRTKKTSEEVKEEAEPVKTQE